MGNVSWDTTLIVVNTFELPSKSKTHDFVG